MVPPWALVARPPRRRRRPAPPEPPTVLFVAPDLERPRPTAKPPSPPPPPIDWARMPTALSDRVRIAPEFCTWTRPAAPAAPPEPPTALLVASVSPRLMVAATAKPAVPPPPPTDWAMTPSALAPMVVMEPALVTSTVEPSPAAPAGAARGAAVDRGAVAAADRVVGVAARQRDRRRRREAAVAAAAAHRLGVDAVAHGALGDDLAGRRIGHGDRARRAARAGGAADRGGRGRSLVAAGRADREAAVAAAAADRLGGDARRLVAAGASRPRPVLVTVTVEALARPGRRRRRRRCPPPADSIARLMEPAKPPLPPPPPMDWAWMALDAAAVGHD